MTNVIIPLMRFSSLQNVTDSVVGLHCQEKVRGGERQVHRGSFWYTLLNMYILDMT